MQYTPKSVRFAGSVCVALLLTAIQSAHAFALLGPFAPWMTAPLVYQLPYAIGGPMNIGEGYRWNVPVITYGYDQSFVDYFGTNGMTAVDGAIQILNDLPPSSQIILSNFPFGSFRVNYFAQSQSLLDLKSSALVMLLQQLGLAQPSTWVFSLRDFSYNPVNYDAEYSVETLNFDPMTLLPTNSVNSIPFGNIVKLSVTGSRYSYAYFGGNSNAVAVLGSASPPGYVNAEVVPINPNEPGPVAVADLAGGPLSSALNLNPGQFVGGLTYDDVGGLRYLLNTNNVALENLLPGMHGTGTNSSNFVSLALRPGMDKITFQSMGNLSSNQPTFKPVTNQYMDTYIVNGVAHQQTLERIVAQPDILFTAKYIGIDSVSRTGTTNWVNNGGPSHSGPGVIQPPVTINFNRFGPGLRWLDPTHSNTNAEMILSTAWGSFDGTANPPTVYPVAPASVNSTELHLLFYSRSSYFPVPKTFFWNLYGQPNAIFLLQTSTNLFQWITIGSITNIGGTFTYMDNVYSNTPQRFFRAVPQ